LKGNHYYRSVEAGCSLPADADMLCCLLCCSTVGDSPDAMSKLTEADLKFLFQI
jgi:hypothetical protein